MKKYLLALLLAFVMVLSLCSCGGSSAAKKAIEGQTFYCNGGTTQNIYAITFEEGNAALVEKTLTSSGCEDGITDSAPYTVDSENITIEWSQTDEMVIPFTIENDKISLDNGKFKSKTDIENTLLGLWSGGKIGYYFGYTLQYNYEYDFQSDGKVIEKYDPYSQGFDLGTYEDKTYTYEVGNGEIVLTKDDDSDVESKLFFNISTEDSEDGEIVLYKEYGVQLYKK